jgi:CRP/FNR family cyclic AMP-dependent transcriptional regulator
MTGLRSMAVFKGLSGEALRQLEQSCVPVEPRHGEAIFSQGDPADSVYAITHGDGHVQIAIHRHRKALMVEILRAGEIFGEIGVIDGGVRTATATAYGRLRLMKMRQTVFLAALANYPTFGDALCVMIAQRLRRTYELLQDATFATLEARLARQIVYLASSEGRPTPQGVRLTNRLRQGDLANLLGVTRGSIITMLNAWRAKGLVIYDTERALLTVTDIAAMRAIVETNV